MPEKKNNHLIPRLILKNWITNDGIRHGVHVFDFCRNKTYFSEPEGKRGYSFAIEKDFYIPQINGVRRVEIEKWFSDLENTLAKVIVKLKAGTMKSLFKSREEMNQFLLSIVSIKHRTKLSVSKTYELINEQPKIKTKLHEFEGKNDKQLVLENIINASNHSAAKFSEFELVICKSNSKSLIFGDNPYIENVVDGFDFVPLTNKFYVGVRKINQNSIFKYLDANDHLINEFNQLLAQNSNECIIADNPSQLKT